MQTIKVHAPASVANLGCGYDTIGFAIEGLGEELEISKRSDNQLVVQEIVGAELSSDPDKNVATVAIKSLLDSLSRTDGFDVRITKSISPGSGLGSSASSASGAVFAVNHLLGKPLTVNELLPFAMEGEALASGSYHADNVAPSLFGGLQVVRSYDPLDLFQLETPEKLKVLIIFPDVTIRTSEAKKIIPKEIGLDVARAQWGNVSALVHAIHTADFDLLKKSVNDFIAEPYRGPLIPGYKEVKKIALESGSVGFNISGSGPTMFSLFVDKTKMDQTAEKIENYYNASGIECQIVFTTIDRKGCRVL